MEWKKERVQSLCHVGGRGTLLPSWEHACMYGVEEKATRKSGTTR